MKIEVVLDRSGSMASIRDATLESLNEYILSLKNDPHAVGAEFRLTRFDTDAIDVIGPKDIKDFPLLTKDDFVPRGGTPLYDAIGKAIASADDSTKDPVLMLIVTDGQENSSREMTLDRVKAIIEGKEKSGSWTFAYIGANQDAWSVGAGMAMAGMTYNGTAGGTRAMYASNAKATSDWTKNAQATGSALPSASYVATASAALPEEEKKVASSSTARMDPRP